MPKDVIDQKDPPCAGETRAQVGGPFWRNVSLSTASEEAPRRHATPPGPPYTACVGRSLSRNTGGLASVLPPHPHPTLGALKCKSKQKLCFSFYISRP